jgi:predicted RNA-binding protein YlxR (DUF448 family)
MLAAPQEQELDAGPRKAAGRERLCAVTRTVKPVDELIRFVVGPDGVVPDVKRRLPGRGLWITADRSTLQDAVTRKVFARGFKRDVRVDPELVELTEQLLASSVLDALAIAGKSGLVAAGFFKVEAALTHDRVAALLHAAESGADGMAKLGGTLRQREDCAQVLVITQFTADQLSLALGRPNVIHAALLAGPATSTFLTRFAHLRRFRAGRECSREGKPGHARN